MSERATKPQALMEQPAPDADPARDGVPGRLAWSLVAAAIVVGVLLALMLLIVAWRVGTAPAG